jgi:excisionase family DNA binding protein
MTTTTTSVQPDTPISGVSDLFRFRLQYNRDEAAEMLGISVRTLDRLIAEKQLQVRRIGRRVLITRDVLTQFVKRDHQTGVVH